MPRPLLICTMLVFLLLSAKAQQQADSIRVTAGVQELIEAQDQTRFAPSYQFFFQEAKNLPPAAYDTLLTMLSSLERQGFRPVYDFKGVFELLTKAKNDQKYTYDKLDQLVQVIGKLGVDNDRRAFDGYLNQLSLLLEGIISNDRSASMILKNADFDILFNKPPDFSQTQVFSSSQMNASSSNNSAPVATGPLDAPLAPILEEYGVVVKIRKADLLIANHLDTFVIRETEGFYNLTESVFSGQDGRLTWENRGVAAEERFARLSQYRFPKNSREFVFENVWLKDAGHLEEPANGDIKLALSPSRLALSQYPEFISYVANNRVKGLGNDNLSFIGGFHLKGNEVLTDTKYGEQSTLIGSKEGDQKFKVRSKNFVFDKKGNTAKAQNASVIVYHNNDSIVNSAVEFSFNYETEVLTAETKVEGYENTPFRSSFFDIEVVGDRLTWDLGVDSLDMTIVAAKREIPLIIESKDYFSKSRYQSLAQIFGFHPLTLAMQMAPNVGDQLFIPQIADKYRLNEKLVERTMRFLKAQGFIEFDEDIGRVTILPKAAHFYNSYVTQLNPSGYDYDDLLIPSIIGTKPNATVSFKDSSMTVRGVDQFVISDSLDVVIMPQNGEIRILENRDIAFDGALNAGNFKFNGTRSVFRYDSFRVELNQINSIELKVELEEGQRQALSNQLVNTSGVLRINEPGNKSALKANPTFPIFKTDQKAKVAFDKEDVLDGAYDSTVYFDVPPFELDSVADADPTKYAFAGTFYSNGMLPEFEADLKVMPDNSFGFIKATPPDSGFSVYQTNGRIIGDIRLDKAGLTSTGVIEYLTGRFELEKSTFFLDSLVAENGLRATIKAQNSEGVQFPDLSIEEFAMNWLAKKDSMILTNKNDQKPFKLFSDQALLRGNVVLGAEGLSGAGDMQLDASKLRSDSIKFQELSFQSRHADFTLNADQSSRPILSSSDVYVNYDLEVQVATIEPEVAGRAAIEFPYAQFKTSIPTAKWDIEALTIVMSKPDSTPLDNSFFYSTNTALDSLVFNGSEAYYDIETSELTIKGIPYIQVADAQIIPQGDSLTVLENSVLESLTKATIYFDTASIYHRLFDAEIDILSRTRFMGRATYELVNALQDTFAIEFNDFELIPETDDTKAHTRASGYVSGDRGVKVSSGFIFEGDITMYAYKEALDLNGAVKLDLAGLKERNIWIEYQSNDDITEVIVPFDQALTRQGQPLNAGLHFDAKGDIYMSFITEKRDYMDYDFFVPKGGDLYFEPKDGSFRIDNPNKLKNPSSFFSGSMFSYNEFEQAVTFEGKLDFLGGNRGDNIESAGKGKGFLDSAKFDVSAMFAISFGLSPEGLGAMAGDMKKIGENVGVPKALDDRSELIYRVAEFIGDEATKKWDNSYRTVPIPLFSVSPLLQKDIVISDVDLTWSKQNNAFFSKGKIGLSNVSNVNLDQEVDGYIEIRKTPEGDIFTLLLELTDGTWYYFNYDGYTLAMFSSNEAFNALVNTFNTGKYKVGNFNPLLISQIEVIQWVTDFRKLYYGIDEPYRLLMAGDSQQTLKKKGTVEGDGF